MGRMLALWTLVTILPTISAIAQVPSKVAQTYEISRSYETTSERGDRGTGSSSGHDIIAERLVAERDGGLELEFDYPEDTPKEQRAQDWQFPARVFRSAEGNYTLLNRPEVEKRIDDWLKKAKIDRRACGTWYFTWNAFKVECDPLSVLKTIARFDIRARTLVAGQPYMADGAIEAVPLRQVTSSSGEASFVADLKLNPDTWRSDAADSDVVSAQILRQALTIEQALAKRAKEQVSGTIEVRLDLGGSPIQVVRRTTTTAVQIVPVEGPVEKQTSNVVIERKPVG